MGKLTEIRKLLSEEVYTLEELIEKTGAKKSTILTMFYVFKKEGLILRKIEKNGVLGYTLMKE